MNVHFSKYHGTGNDFILIDGRNIDLSYFGTGSIQNLCDRRFGIGADGLIILMESENLDFRMKYYNSNGLEGSMCGNGGRCITAFARNLGIIRDEARFDGIDGIHHATIFEDALIRLKLKDVVHISRFEDGIFLDTGSPHFVKFVDDTDEIDVDTLGKEIRFEERFQPGGVNVNFAQKLPKSNHIKVRTFERGVEAETLSCGTGVTASAISAYIQEKPDKLSFMVESPGGILQVSFNPETEMHFTDVYLTGPAMHVFDGNTQIFKSP